MWRLSALTICKCFVCPMIILITNYREVSKTKSSRFFYNPLLICICISIHCAYITSRGNLKFIFCTLYKLLLELLLIFQNILINFCIHRTLWINKQALRSNKIQKLYNKAFSQEIEHYQHTETHLTPANSDSPSLSFQKATTYNLLLTILLKFCDDIYYLCIHCQKYI